MVLKRDLVEKMCFFFIDQLLSQVQKVNVSVSIVLANCICVVTFVEKRFVVSMTT